MPQLPRKLIVPVAPAMCMFSRMQLDAPSLLRVVVAKDGRIKANFSDNSVLLLDATGRTFTVGANHDLLLGLLFAVCVGVPSSWVLSPSATQEPFTCLY